MLIFKGDKLRVRNGVLEFGDAPADVLRDSRDLPAVWQDMEPWCEVEDAEDTCGEASVETEWIDLRAVWQRWGEETFVRAGTAYQYMNWLRHARFCSSCGAPLSAKEEDKGLSCGGCGRTVYAPLHPAIIVAVEREGKLLLAHNTRMPSKRYSVLAGFVEPGESLEQTVQREIMEEVGIEVQDIRYFGSQSWPFPCSLMLGFTARWQRGELRPDGTELDDAGWFLPCEFPDIPPGLSISRRLIDDFVRRRQQSVSALR
ncbi:MAG: NAD(+) diphosphatase [Synergistaceae bacterium]|jgi:NAD+ diphosphatase|nr:NAD(+) diphosphatase [Synergistaceae bacterium]